MAQIFQNQIGEYLNSTRKPPNEGYKERLNQARKLNSIAQVMNLVGQGIFTGKGANILPQKDAVTPFVMNEYGRMREEELARGEEERKFGVNALTKDIDYGIQEDRLKTKYDKDAEKQKANQDFTAGQTEKAERFKETPEQKYKRNIDSARIMGDQKTADQIELERERSKLRREENREKAHYSILQAKARAKDKNSILTIKDADGEFNFDANDVTNIYTYLMDDEEVMADIKKENIPVYYKFKYDGNAPSKEFMATKIRQYWDKKAKPMYGGQGAQQQSNNQPTNQPNKQALESALSEIDMVMQTNHSQETKQRVFYEALKQAGLTKQQIDELWKIETAK